VAIIARPKVTESFTYRYFVLGETTPVRALYDNEGLLRGTQVPDPSQTGGYALAMEYIGVIEGSAQSSEIDDPVEFEEYVDAYLQQQFISRQNSSKS
jgi:hypothetical protein